jgi:hypothetical protein
MINSKNFDNIRTVALVCILLLHTVLMNVGIVDFTKELTEKSFCLNFNQLLSHALFNNLFKPGTILFFIISGFLFEMQFLKFTDFLIFFKKKAKSLLRPYLILFVIPIIIIIGIVEPNIGVKENITLSGFLIKTFENILLTNYWFVPALFVTLLINYFIKSKDLFKALVLFFIVWIIAYLNIYLQFTFTMHNIWFPAFFFIFTLGRLMYIYNDKIAKISIIKNNKKLFLLTILFYIFSNLESIFIMRYGLNSDFINTLKIGNILYSFSLFYLLNGVLNKSNFVIPIDISFYFIYLIHPLLLKITNYLLLTNNLTHFEYPSQYFYNILHFIIILIVSIVIQQIFFKLRFKSKAISEYVFKK